MKSLKNKLAKYVMALVMIGAAFLFSGEFEAGQVKAYAFEWGYITASELSMRQFGSANAPLIMNIKKGTKVKCYSLKTDWVKVTYNNKSGYCKGKYIRTAYGTASSPYANVRRGKVTSTVLNIRTEANGTAPIMAVLKKGEFVQVLITGKEWVTVKLNGEIGYTQGKYLVLGDGGTATDPTPAASAQATKLINFAKKFLGNRYVWGGTSLTHGTDCSGFTMRVFEHFGYRIPRTSATQRSCGRRVASLKQARAGDLICYYGHVAIYMGNNRIIHASNARDGIKISNNAAYRPIASIRRVLK